MIFGVPTGVHTVYNLLFRATDPFGESVVTTYPVEIEEFPNQPPVVKPGYEANSGPPAFATPLNGIGVFDVFGLSNF